MGNQLSLFDLLVQEADKGKSDRIENWWNWLLDVRLIDAGECRAIFDSLIESFEIPEAFERSKSLNVLSGKRKVPGWCVDDVDVLGLLDKSIDYHTVWDKAWGARNGYGKKDVRKMTGWDYGKQKPIY